MDKIKFFFYKLWAKFLTAFGNIKCFDWPLFLVYDPTYFKMDGPHMKKALDLIQPGDVILRGYDSYLDGKFIDDNYKYSHGALYIGHDKIIHAVAEGVSEIDILEFMQCDRICIFRPAKYQKAAISKAKQFLKNNVKYDFSFRKGSSALYCFELCAECYDKLSLQKIKVSKFLGLVKRHVYLAESFRQSKDFTRIFEYNPKFKIDI